MQWPDPMCLTPHTKYCSVHHVSLRAFAHCVRGKLLLLLVSGMCVVYRERTRDPCVR